MLMAYFLSVALAATAPADIRLEWLNGMGPVEGPGGKSVELRYAVRNVGGAPAFAVVLRTLTSLGPNGQPVRLQPGPDSGTRFDRTLSLALASGIREICIDASLQNKNHADPLDPTPSDNRICRVVRVTKGKDAYAD